MSRASEPLAVFSVSDWRSWVGGNPHSVLITELAGARSAVLGGLKKVGGDFGVEAIDIQAYAHDRALLEQCVWLGVKPQAVAFSHTFKLLDVQRL